MGVAKVESKKPTKLYFVQVEELLKSQSVPGLSDNKMTSMHFIITTPSEQFQGKSNRLKLTYPSVLHLMNTHCEFTSRFDRIDLISPALQHPERVFYLKCLREVRVVTS